MKAIVYTKYGGPEALQLKEVKKPYPADDEVLIKICAASLNDWDWGLLQGDFFNRLFNGLFRPKRQILGSDIAGRVEQVGKAVQLFKSGDEVYGDLSGLWGGFAEYACAPEKMLVLKPASMSFEEAAAIPQAAMLAVQGLADVGKIREGQKLLINGAGGGVGTFAVQIARLYQAEVAAVDHTNKLSLLRSMGFDHVIDYTREDFTKNCRHYDLILDVKTNRPPLAYARVLNESGTYVSLGGNMGHMLLGLLFKPWFMMDGKKHFHVLALKPNKDLLYINELFETGQLKPVIDGPYLFRDFGKAFRLFGRAAHRGKIVMTWHAGN